LSNTTPDADLAVLLQQGFESLRQGDFARAERRAVGARARSPGHPLALNLLALSLHGQGRNAEAIGYIEQLQRLEPTDLGHWMNAGTILRALKRIPEALAAYKRAQQLGENGPDFYYNVGLLHLDQGNPAAARVALSTAHAACPNDGEISFTAE